jgi:hypothetical protein
MANKLTSECNSPVTDPDSTTVRPIELPRYRWWLAMSYILITGMCLEGPGQDSLPRTRTDRSSTGCAGSWLLTFGLHNEYHGGISFSTTGPPTEIKHTRYHALRCWDAIDYGCASCWCDDGLLVAGDDHARVSVSRLTRRRQSIGRLWCSFLPARRTPTWLTNAAPFLKTRASATCAVTPVGISPLHCAH